MESKNTKLFFSLLVLASILAQGSAIRCFVCNSHLDKRCLGASDDDMINFHLNCDTLNNPAENKTYTFCRKIETSLDSDFGPEHLAGKRIQRDCGYRESEDGDCYYKSGYNTRSWVCSCQSDDCNAAGFLRFSPWILIITLVSMFIGSKF